jgi:hypothetical protein
VSTDPDPELGFPIFPAVDEEVEEGTVFSNLA